jgi:hydrogenase assembly chaperone HypC/HupF
MCLIAPGRVVGLDGDVAIVEIVGRRRRASILLEPDVVEGDWVILAGGSVLRRVDDQAAADMTAALATVGVDNNADVKGTRDD